MKVRPQNDVDVRHSAVEVRRVDEGSSGSRLLRLTEQHVPVVNDGANHQAEGAQPQAQLVDVIVGAPRIPSRIRGAEGASVDLGVRDGAPEVLEKRHKQGVSRKGQPLSVESRNILEEFAWPI